MPDSKRRREAIAELLAEAARIHDGGITVHDASGFYAFFDRMSASVLQYPRDRLRNHRRRQQSLRALVRLVETHRLMQIEERGQAATYIGAA